MIIVKQRRLVTTGSEKKPSRVSQIVGYVTLRVTVVILERVFGRVSGEGGAESE